MEALPTSINISQKWIHACTRFNKQNNTTDFDTIKPPELPIFSLKPTESSLTEKIGIQVYYVPTSNKKCSYLHKVGMAAAKYT